MRKSETAVQSDHVLKFVYDKDAQFIRGIVQASMRDRSYRLLLLLVLTTQLNRVPVNVYMGWTNVTIKPAFFSMAMHWILSPEPPVPTLAVPLVEDLISSQEFISAENPIAWMKQKLMINEQEIQQIACLTTGQKENCMWSSVRKNRSTASNFGCVLAAIKRNRYPVSLYKRLCSAYDLSKKDAIIWGTCNEKVAIEKYRTFGDAVVEPTGIWLHCNGVLGSSPDGLIRCPAAFGFSYQNPGLADILEMSNVKPEILEVKCPFSAKNMTIPEAIEKVHDFCLEVQDFNGVKSFKL
ncbi:uncharacterized protein LOC134247962 isoform X1 [Saccostrea cucullata]|uniref:uncharacterized protein LOC134247962 isoform X1 n=1 Tax=Saccostrea cuccullata TaxID=36930 RepID=UPI002ED57FA3